MEYIKLQICCILLVSYVIFTYIREKHVYDIVEKDVIFETLLKAGTVTIIFDGATAYTVNHLSQIPDIVNDALHLCFLCGINITVFVMFIYILDIVSGIPKSRKIRFLIILPFIFSILGVVLFIGKLDYIQGDITNYSMGMAAYFCFLISIVYTMSSIIVLFNNRKNLESHKLVTLSTNIIAQLAVILYQSAYPESLITSLVPTFAIIGSYLNMENPVLTKLQNYNREMVTGFATLVENRDNSTGGHIKRTTAYVGLLAEELKARGHYKDILTEDYIKNLVMAAPMHDVGKIAIPDAILQKPGRLTAEEYEIMKQHAERGGVIIKETFGKMGDEEYEEIAYDVARHHHEKWNGKGYPDGLSKKNIPLCARIMAVADVFDAVSAKRCYRDALPLEECFAIIEQGSGEDFEPVIAEIFLGMKDKITEVYEKQK